MKNEYGPQTQQNYTNALDKLMTAPENCVIVKQRKAQHSNIDLQTREISSLCNSALNERLDELEQTINLKPISSDIYKRIKAIESRIIYLETVSPEYKKFLVRILHSFVSL